MHHPDRFEEWARIGMRIRKTIIFVKCKVEICLNYVAWCRNRLHPLDMLRCRRRIGKFSACWQAGSLFTFNSLDTIFILIFASSSFCFPHFFHLVLLLSVLVLLFFFFSSRFLIFQVLPSLSTIPVSLCLSISLIRCLTLFESFCFYFSFCFLPFYW